MATWRGCLHRPAAVPRRSRRWVAAACIVLVFNAAAEDVPAPVATLPVRLGLAAEEFDALWLLPAGAPVGLVSVQHGFARRCSHLHGTLTALARSGLIVLCLNAEMAGGNPRLAQALAAALRDGLGPPGHAAAALPIVVAGHSAGALFGSHLGAALAREAPDRLAGAVLFDPVAGAGFVDNLLAISNRGTRPVRAISASFSACNAGNNADAALSAVHQAAAAAGQPVSVGLRLVDRATHVDAEGEDTSALAVWACGQGAPQPANLALLRTLAVAWALEMVLGSPGADADALAELVEQALANGQAVPIR
jgi:pimeloyl-ACP methyl ester carboxylesterase